MKKQVLNNFIKAKHREQHKLVGQRLTKIDQRWTTVGQLICAARDANEKSKYNIQTKY